MTAGGKNSKCRNCAKEIVMHGEHRYWFHDKSLRRTCEGGWSYAEPRF